MKKHSVLSDCHIYSMLRKQPRHLSFHTPGHKRSGLDITELSYSDNLSSPKGCIAKAESDLAHILGAEKSFILTDGSTAGILSMLHAFACAGYTRLAIPDFAHKSVKNGCKICKITPIEYRAEQLILDIEGVLLGVDGLLVVSPDYYGKIPDLQAIQRMCQSHEKPLLIDGAHGGHLHFEKNLYAGSVADMWVDGVHKSLPAMTQGAVVSAKTKVWAERLRDSVDVFRTTSPSYPIMASVEYAVKYPRAERLEKFVWETVKNHNRFVLNEDWTKLCFLAGKDAFFIQAELEQGGIFAEFCDGEILMFYLSPATKIRWVKTLIKKLDKLAKKYPYVCVEHDTAPILSSVIGETEKVDLEKGVGRICARECGLFPPCIPLIEAGETITQEKLELLKKANNVFGLTDGQMTVLKADTEE